MKRAPLLFLLASLVTPAVAQKGGNVEGGQAVHENDADAAAISKLNSALTALNDARASQTSVSEQVVETMMLLAENEERPLRPIVERFADELTKELVGKRLKTDQIIPVTQNAD